MVNETPLTPVYLVAPPPMTLKAVNINRPIVCETPPNPVYRLAPHTTDVKFKWTNRVSARKFWQWWVTPLTSWAINLKWYE